MDLSIDIARSHLETMIERITGVDKAVPDHDGDYLIRTQSAGFFARVDGADRPVIRVFSILVDRIDKSPELLDALNDCNARLSFLRAMWVQGQVMIEGEMLAFTADTVDFDQVCSRIAHASDYFGPRFIEQFGGQAWFERSKQDDYATPEPPSAGYL